MREPGTEGVEKLTKKNEVQGKRKKEIDGRMTKSSLGSLEKKELK